MSKMIFVSLPVTGLQAAHGGRADVNPVQDLGFMYSRDLADPDDNLWGAFWMDPAALPAETKDAR